MSTAPRHRARLSDDRRRLAADYLPLALSLAAPFARCYPRDGDDYVSRAMLELCRAALEFDPGLGLAFGARLRFRIWRELVKEWRRLNYRRRRYGPPRSLDAAPEPHDPPDASLESADAVEAMLRPLSGRHAAAVRLTVLAGYTQAEAARELGVSQPRINSLRREALELMRGRLACT